MTSDTQALIESLATQADLFVTASGSPQTAHDFALTESEHRHAVLALRACPQLADLRYRLCPMQISEARFWQRYFELLRRGSTAADAEVALAATSTRLTQIEPSPASPALKPADSAEFELIEAPVLPATPDACVPVVVDVDDYGLVQLASLQRGRAR